MNEFTQIGEAVAETSEYAEVLSLILAEAEKQTEYLSGIYGVGWVLCGVVTGCVCAYLIYKMVTT